MPILAIVSPEDTPIYQTSFPNMSGKLPTCIEQLVLHSSLDMVDEKVCTDGFQVVGVELADED